MTHRDLKPENILYDEQYNLKIADFGFAAPIEGKDGSGYLKTRLGTESYMAPEIHMKKGYLGESVDLFAAGIILFIMFTQHPPFHKAIPDDPFYKLICINRMDVFWKAHSKNKPTGEAFFSPEFRDLITSLLAYNPADRITLDQVKSHPWYTNSNISTLQEIQGEFGNRQKAIESENKKKKEEKEQNAELQAQKQRLKEKILKGKGIVNQRKVYAGHDRDLGEESKGDESL